MASQPSSRWFQMSCPPSHFTPNKPSYPGPLWPPQARFMWMGLCAVPSPGDPFQNPCGSRSPRSPPSVQLIGPPCTALMWPLQRSPTRNEEIRKCGMAGCAICPFSATVPPTNRVKWNVRNINQVSLPYCQQGNWILLTCIVSKCFS